MIKMIIIYLCCWYNISIAQENIEYFFIAERSDENVYEKYIFNESGEKLFKDPKSSIYFNEWNWMIVRNKDKKYTVFCPPDYQHSIKDIQEVPHMWGRKGTMFPLLKADKWGFYNRKGLPITTHKFDVVTYFYKGKAAVKIEDYAYYINGEGEKLDEPYSPNESYEFSDFDDVVWELDIREYDKYTEDRNTDLITENNKKGLKDSRTEEVIIPCIYDRILQMGNILKYFMVVKDGKWGVYSIEGKRILEPIYDLIWIEKISIKN